MSAQKRWTKKALYIFDWVGGGYNQVLASRKAEALGIAKAIGARSSLEVNLSTFRRLSARQEQEYWRSFNPGGSRWTD